MSDSLPHSDSQHLSFTGSASLSLSVSVGCLCLPLCLFLVVSGPSSICGPALPKPVPLCLSPPRPPHCPPSPGQPFDPSLLLAQATCNITCSLVFDLRLPYDSEEFQAVVRAAGGIAVGLSSPWGQVSGWDPSPATFPKGLPGNPRAPCPPAPLPWCRPGPYQPAPGHKVSQARDSTPVPKNATFSGALGPLPHFPSP